MSILYRILIALMALRLLMPPGICACKLSSPAARLLAGFFRTGLPQPAAPSDAEDDDHAPGCPASPLAVGMGLKPASHPILPPDLALERPPALEEAVLASCIDSSPAPAAACGSATGPLYLTLCALVI